MKKLLFTSPFGEVLLHQTHADVLPYNQADVYLLQQLKEIFTGQKIAIVNDSYGALATSLAALNPACYNDSAIYRECLANNLPHHTLQHLEMDNLHQTDADIVLMRLPKNLHYFRYQLAKLSQLPHITVLLAGMQKHWPASFFRVAEDYFSDATALLGVKKAKCMVLKNGKNRQDVETVFQLSTPEFGLELCNYPNVFSREQMDIGSRFFLQNFPDLSQCQHILDLACGNGLLGLYAQRKFPHLHAHYVDESAFAILSCHTSLKANGIASERYTLHHNNSLNQLDLPKMDAILCNPPFHQQHLVSDHIAGQMIRDSRRVLNENGKLLLIGNRHLPYYMLLKKQFRNVSTLAGNNKFVIYQASQPL